MNDYNDYKDILSLLKESNERSEVLDLLDTIRILILYNYEIPLLSAAIKWKNDPEVLQSFNETLYEMAPYQFHPDLKHILQKLGLK